MLKVLQISNKAPFPANDGSSIAIYNMARGLSENGVELHLISINTKKHFKPDSMVPLEFKANTRYKSVYKNTNVTAAGALRNLFSRASYFVSRFYFKEFEEKLVYALGMVDFDIVQLEGLFMGVYIDVIRKHSRAKIVLRAHNIEHHIWKRHIEHERFGFKKLYLLLQNSRLRKFELGIMEKADAVVPITITDQKALQALGCTKPMHACITGVNVAEYQASEKVTERAQTIFYFGSMDWLPNQEAVAWFLEKCWEKVHKAVPQAKLIIAGRGMPLEFFHITRPNVMIVENVENGRQFFRQHQVMIVPLLSGSGLRIKIIEGMAYGKAIVSTAIGAEGIAYSNKENILIADDPSDFADAVILLLQSEETKRKIERNAASFAASEFDNGRVVAALVDFYKNLPDA
jgi:glycosyltransferase involved in cell wall biosynthesis